MKQKWKFKYWGWDWSVQACRGRCWCFFLCPPTMAFFHILNHRFSTHTQKNYDSIWWSPHVEILSEETLPDTHVLPQAAVWTNFWRAKNSPKFCPTWKNPLNLASTTLHLYQNIFWHITCSLRVHISPTTVQEVPPSPPQYPRNSCNSAHQFFKVFFLASGRCRPRSFKEVDPQWFLSIVYEDLAFSTPMAGWKFTV